MTQKKSAAWRREVDALFVPMWYHTDMDTKVATSMVTNMFITSEEGRGELGEGD